MKILAVALLMLSVSGQLMSQSNKLVTAEIGGEGGLYSLNYDSRLSSGNNGLGYRIGLSFYEDVLVIPVQLNHLIGNNGKYVEVGGGVSLITGVIDFGNGTEGLKAIPTISLKYRSQPVDGGFSWSIGILSATSILPVWGVVGLGYAF